MSKSQPITLSAIAKRLRAELPLKLMLLMVLDVWVYVPYHYLQHHHFFPGRAIPASFFDRLIPFSDGAVWAYFSVYLLMPIGPFLMIQRGQIFRYAWGIAIISMVADFVFAVWPTSCLRPAALGTNAVYRMLIAIDNPYDAFPSLHAAFAVYSALCAGQVLNEFRWGVFLRGAAWFWALLVLYATLATKQHMAADIVAGSVLALGVYAGVFYREKSGVP
jgi:membrane-associated phospholipid phosphatase